MSSYDVKRVWEDKISDTNERKVFEALENPRWDFRTIEGLSRSTRLSLEEIRKIVNKHLDVIQLMRFPDQKGRRLYALRGKSKKRLELLNALRVFISKSFS